MGHYFRSFRIVVFLIALFGLTTAFGQEFSIAQLIGKSKVGNAEQVVPLNPEVALAFERMCEAALKDSIKITAVSGYRNFDRQKLIWERKYNNHLENGLTPEAAIKKIIKYSAIPGTSRHHWGTEIDIIDMAVDKPDRLLVPSHYKKEGPYGNLKAWMDTHANEYGFYLVYTEEDRKGFKYEPWHYSYLKLSKPMLESYLLLDLKKIYQKYSFDGSDNFTDEFLTKYTLEHIADINPELR